MESILHIKNMVCPRCIKVVSDELCTLGFDIHHIELGKVELKSAPTSEDLQKIKTSLKNNGFELLDDKKSRVIEKVKILIIEGIRDGKFSEMNINFSQYLSKELQMEYTHLSSLFSSVEGKSIERFVILQKTERIKELITYGELSMKEIAHFLDYSSLQALSGQFKKETGLTPTAFKALSDGNSRKPISSI
ncbi:MAG: transcriptional regulator, AraC family [Cytophagaceae bacterium]|jgi:AraC-like DNA-binding protein|nr:transcriptional regulator, AraC family [Cytophagaceae bacterium]